MSGPAELERWKATLLTAPDDRFFDVMRSVFGDIKTPFNKQELLQRLITYLKKRETKDRILSTISGIDVFLLTTIWVLDNPPLTRLYRFLSGSMRYLDLHNHLLNLEERMLIYRSVDETDEKIRVNPLLRDDLKRVMNPDLVFESTETDPCEPAWLRDELLLSVIAFVREKPDLFTSGGELKSRVRREAEERFSFAGTGESAHRVRLLIRALLSCGLMRETSGAIEVLLPRLAAFGRLPAESRSALLAGGLAARKDGPGSGGKPGDGGGDESGGAESGGAAGRDSLVLTFAHAALLLRGHLLADRSYPDITLERIVLAGGMSLKSSELEGVVEAMVSLGLLTRVGENYTIRPGAPEKREIPGCVVQPNFEATLTGDVALSEGMNLALGTELRLYDASPVFEITREAVTRRFGDGVSAGGFIETLEGFAGRPLPPNVVFSLESWEREFRSVRIFSGAVLLVDEERRHLVEHSGEMSRLIISMPAPGVYLIDGTDRKALENALRDCGIDQMPAVIGPPKAEAPPAEAKYFEGFPPRRTKHLGLHFPGTADTEEPATDVRAELHEKLDSMDLDTDVREDLARMIEKGLLLYPEQLDYRASSPREKREAKGFDYLGKVRIIEQALSRSDLLLEIITRSGEGKTTKLLVSPLELKKSGSDLHLVCSVFPDQERSELKVRSMSLVRSVRGSLYPRHSSG